MERKFQKFLYADSDDADTWFTFQNVDGKNEFISLVFMFTSWIMAIEGFGWRQQKINKNHWPLSRNCIDWGFRLLFMRFWGVRYWHSPELASIYQMSVTPIVFILLIAIQNLITCTIFGKSSTRPFRCTYNFLTK